MAWHWARRSEPEATASEVLDGARVQALTLPLESDWDPWLRRFFGDGFLNLVAARAEVQAALRADGGLLTPRRPAEDALRPALVPSIASGDFTDRVLAEIDQDGFAFASDPIDQSFFNRRDQRAPRQQNLIDIVLKD